jgi:hypothetical protein
MINVQDSHISLSEIVAKLENDESIKFNREPMAIRCVIKKGNELQDYKQIAIMFDSELIEQNKFDVLSLEIEHAFEVIRRQSIE